MEKIDDIETLFKQHYASMYSLASMLLHDNEAAHDIVHDVFVSILDKKTSATFDSTYLMASVRNRCLNHLRKFDVRERFRELYILENAEDEDTQNSSDDETFALIEECEKIMSPQCAKIFKLRFHEGISSKDISQMLGIGERGIYKHLNHALNIIKHKLNG